MPEYLSPGVYIEEFETGAVPIAGVGTSTAGFVGPTERGSVDPQRITSFDDYQRTFGRVATAEFQDIGEQASYLMYAVDGFFRNGGSECYVGRVTAEDAVRASAEVDGVTIEAIGPGTWGNTVQVGIQEALDERFNIVISYWRDEIPDDPEENPPQKEERYNDLSHKRGPGYYAKTVNNASTLIEIKEGATDPLSATTVPLEGGENGGVLGKDDFEGRETQVPTASEDPDEERTQRTGLKGFTEVDRIAIVCFPDEGKLEGLTESLVLHCQQMEDRFAILQTEQGIVPDTIIEQSGDIIFRSPKGLAALYYPWLKILDPLTNAEMLVPPGGHIAGVYARTDTERGVHKAPANEQLRGIQELEQPIRRDDQDGLNPLGVNCIRSFRGRGTRVWGARTTSSNILWRYVNVRRLFLFIEESLDEGTQWAVFEPNDEPLWARVRQSVTTFLTGVWRDGALQGTTPEEAFYVKCDRTTMTQDDIDQGRLIIEVGVAPVKPAEFVIFRITQKRDAEGA